MFETINEYTGVLDVETQMKLQTQTEILQETMRELRDICVGLFPPILEYGLEVVIKDVAQRFEQKFGLTIVQNITVSTECVENVSVPVATAVYRVLTEALNNVVKHAQTKHVWITLDRVGDNLRLEIADDGVGLNIAFMSLPDLLRRKHLGLVGMYEWSEMVAGTLTFSTHAPQGTAVILEIPISEVVQ